MSEDMSEDDQSYFEDEDFLESLEAYEQALSEGRPVYMDADELTDIAEYYSGRGEEAKAGAAIDLALRLHPDSVDPQVFRARQLMLQGDLKGARELCRAIPDQEDNEVLFLRAELLLKEDKAGRAVRLLRDAAERMREDADTFLHDCASLFMDYDYWDDALRFAEHLRVKFPAYPKLKDIFAEIYVSQGKYEKGETLLRELLDKDPYKADSWSLLAEAQNAQEDYAQALESAEYALAIDPGDKNAKLSKATSLFHLGTPAEAHEIYSAYLKENPKDDITHYFDALCLAALERYEEAAERLRLANETGGGNSSEQLHIYLEQALVEGRLHHFREAVDALDNARTLAGEDTDIEYDLRLGEVLLENGREEEAAEHFKSALAQTMDRRTTMLSIGVAYGQSQHYREAADTLAAVVRDYPDEKGQSALPYLAYCYMNTGDTPQFLKYLKKAVASDKESTEILFKTRFPGILPEEYYMCAFREAYGRYPKKGE